MIKFLKVLLVLATLSSQTIQAQVEATSDLFIQLAKMDSIIFERGFNMCLLAEIGPSISDDLEFYHDQGGLSETKIEFLDALKQNICSNFDKKPIRKLANGSLNVFPLDNNGVLYAAIQHGEHEFYIKEPNRPAYLTSTAMFTHVWILENDSWILKRVLSYDHKSPGETHE